MPSQTASKCHTICSPYKINLPGHMHSRRKQYADINSRCKACKGSEFSNFSAVTLSLSETRYWGKYLLSLNAHLHKIPCLGTVKPFKFSYFKSGLPIRLLQMKLEDNLTISLKLLSLNRPYYQLSLWHI